MPDTQITRSTDLHEAIVARRSFDATFLHHGRRISVKGRPIAALSYRLFPDHQTLSGKFAQRVQDSAKDLCERYSSLQEPIIGRHGVPDYHARLAHEAVYYVTTSRVNATADELHITVLGYVSADGEAHVDTEALLALSRTKSDAVTYGLINAAAALSEQLRDNPRLFGSVITPPAETAPKQKRTAQRRNERRTHSQHVPRYHRLA